MLIYMDVSCTGSTKLVSDFNVENFPSFLARNDSYDRVDIIGMLMRTFTLVLINNYSESTITFVSFSIVTFSSS